jgi:nucleoside-diphosphate-sugar epimerase
MFMNSVVATRNLLDAIVGMPAPAKLVHCSSFSVIGIADLPRGGMVDESRPMDAHPERRDSYSHSKHRQEQIVWEYQREHGLRVVVLRPGVIYGPGGGVAMSNRVGLRLFGVFLHLGRKNVLPLTYVDNCADAFVVAGRSDTAIGQIYNVVDDDLVHAKHFLTRYREQVEKVRYVTLPWFATKVLSAAVEKYVDYSKGQLPAIFTRYKTDSMWKGNRFSNEKLKSIGWHPRVSTDEGIRRHFEYFQPPARVP